MRQRAGPDKTLTKPVPQDWDLEGEEAQGGGGAGAAMGGSRGKWEGIGGGRRGGRGGSAAGLGLRQASPARLPFEPRLASLPAGAGEGISHLPTQRPLPCRVQGPSLPPVRPASGSQRSRPATVLAARHVHLCTPPTAREATKTAREPRGAGVTASRASGQVRLCHTTRSPAGRRRCNKTPRHSQDGALDLVEGALVHLPAGGTPKNGLKDLRPQQLSPLESQVEEANIDRRAAEILPAATAGKGKTDTAAATTAAADVSASCRQSRGSRCECQDLEESRRARNRVRRGTCWIGRFGHRARRVRLWIHLTSMRPVGHRCQCR